MEERVFQGMEYVYEVYKEGSFNKAAQKLYISQPSVSATVRRIEERLGCRIFDRGVKPLQLTECGKMYIAAAEKIFALEREFAEYVNDWGGLQRGKLVLGGSSLFSSLVLPPMMVSFGRRYPQVQLELREDTTAQLEDALRSGSVDIIVDYEIPHQEEYDAALLEEDVLLLAVPQAFRVNASLASYRIDANLVREKSPALADTPPLPLELLRDEPFILLKAGNDSRRRADQLCQEHGFVPRVAMEFDQQMTSYHASDAGIGISFLSSTLVSRVSPANDLIYYRLDGASSTRRVCLFWKRGRYLTRAMEAFLRLTADGDDAETRAEAQTYH